jgi:hypothetical protein
MTRMTVITKSFAPDFGLCAALNRSMPENSPDTILHHIIVPESDLTLFGRLAGPRTHIRCEADFLPRTFVRLPLSNIMVNVARPFPPGAWLDPATGDKAGGDCGVGGRAVLLVDSGVEFFRPFTAETFVRDGRVRFFRKPNPIDKRLSRQSLGE